MKRTTTRGKINSIPRIRDLPKKQQEAFRLYLIGQVRPLLKGVNMDNQDGYYQEQFEKWRAGTVKKRRQSGESVYEFVPGEP